MNPTTWLIAIVLMACTPLDPVPQHSPANKKQFSEYWYAGEAEISSYELVQDRYGELHKGNAVLVFVTEPFSKSANAKADRPTDKDVPVLKLNYTKKFNTGVYPYSMMTSTFLPVENGSHSLKVSSSSQEWCGHTFMELQNKSKFIVNIDSYFEGETAENVKMDKHLLEDDVMSLIRINPDDLPTGKLQMIPSFFYLRTRHKPMQAYDVEVELKTASNNQSSYVLNYPRLGREVTIDFETEFPHRILSWTEADSSSGLTSTATLIKTIKSDYWNRHFNKDLPLREELGLPVKE